MTHHRARSLCAGASDTQLLHCCLKSSSKKVFLMRPSSCQKVFLAPTLVRKSFLQGRFLCGLVLARVPWGSRREEKGGPEGTLQCETGGLGVPWEALGGPWAPLGSPWGSPWGSLGFPGGSLGGPWGPCGVPGGPWGSLGVQKIRAGLN